MWSIFLALYLIGVMIAFGLILEELFHNDEEDNGDRLPWVILICCIFSWILVGLSWGEINNYHKKHIKRIDRQIDDINRGR